MYSAFKKALPQVSIFHRASSPPSASALQLLQSALAGPYPPSNPAAPPLQFDLEVVDAAPPTADQLPIILSYLSHLSHRSGSSPARKEAAPKINIPISAFLSAHAASASPPAGDARAVAQLARESPDALRWPIVVDWTGGRASVGDVEGVKGILEAIRAQRDGEAGGEDIQQPKGWFS
ncbi:hypothetical protein FIBSPDRAFT_853096 [Athelia psychrophila]|uniref:Thioredoxin-like protein n=1 Tax=Athelia psychrophila TaxID=1759441 RepID=A0A166R543_9AGAM|nr:hypothetical protein FIBSPDRAFT_853096 [Fibularhizoctonia sp. CBS 109695]